MLIPRKILFLSLLSAFLAANSADAGILCNLYLRFSRNVNALAVRLNTFPTGRVLADYVKAFGEPLLTALHSLTASSHWIDVGAGQARAQLDFLNASPEVVKTTAISVRRPFLSFSLERGLRAAFPEKAAVRRYIEGYIESTVVEKADIVTDLFGAILYSPNIDVTLKAELEALKTNGQLFVYVPHFLFTITNPTGTNIGLSGWLRNVKGVEIVKNDSIGTFILRRTSGPLEIPALELTSMTADVAGSTRGYSLLPHAVGDATQR